MSNGNDGPDDNGIEIIGSVDPRIMAIREATDDEDSDERLLTDLTPRGFNPEAVYLTRQHL